MGPPSALGRLVGFAVGDREYDSTDIRRTTGGLPLVEFAAPSVKFLWSSAEQRASPKGSTLKSSLKVPLTLFNELLGQKIPAEKLLGRF